MGWCRSLHLLRMAAALPLLFSALAQATTDDAGAWIARMNQTLSSSNYEGVIVHKFGGRSETLRIYHRVRDGRMTERLIATDGSGWQSVRNGADYVEYRPQHRQAWVKTLNRSYGFITTLNRVNKDSERNYSIALAGNLKVWGRQTQVVTVTPRDALRYGYVFWLDQQNALPIRTQLVSQKGEVIEEIEFISLSLPESISDDVLKPDAEVARLPRVSMDARALNTAPVRVAFVPRKELLPTGFRELISKGVNLNPPAPAPRTRFLVTDDIATVSVFVAAPEASAKSEPQVDTLNRYGTLWVYEAWKNGYKVTVVGAVPQTTIKSIAEAMQPE